MIGRLNIKRRGGVINGLIEQYKVASGGNVSAGDFVKFIDELESGVTNKQESYSIYTSGELKRIKAVKVSETCVFIAFAMYSSSYTSNIYGIVCNITGNSINFGIETTLSTRTIDSNYTRIISPNNNSVVVFITTSNSPKEVYAIMCTIDNTTITVKTEREFNSSADGTEDFEITDLGNEKAVINYGSLRKSGSNSYSVDTYISVVTIGSTSISEGTRIKHTNGDPTMMICCATNKVAYLRFVSSSIYGYVCTISGTTISFGSEQKISSSNDFSYGEGVKIEDNKVFTAVKTYSNQVSGRIFLINGEQITAGSATILKNYTQTSPTTLLMSVNRVFVGYKNSTLYGMSCIINSNEIQIEKEGNFSGNGDNISPILLNEKNFVAIYIQNTEQKLITVNEFDWNGVMVKRVKLLENKDDKIAGIAKKSGREGQAIDVYVPNVQ